MEETKQIVVNSSAIPANVMTFIRYALVAAGGFLVTKGYLDNETLNSLVSVLLILIPTAYGVYKTQKNNDIKVNLANKVPDEVAVVK